MLRGSGCAGCYRQAYAWLLDSIALSNSEILEGYGDLLSLLQHKAQRANLIAWQLVDQEAEAEAAYRECELANMLLEEVRDLPPHYDQLRTKPVRDEAYFWRCREASEVSFQLLVILQ